MINFLTLWLKSQFYADAEYRVKCDYPQLLVSQEAVTVSNQT